MIVEPSDSERGEWSDTTELYVQGLEDGIGRLRKILEWYGDESNYHEEWTDELTGVSMTFTGPISRDDGMRAREILKGVTNNGLDDV